MTEVGVAESEASLDPPLNTLRSLGQSNHFS